MNKTLLSVLVLQAFKWALCRTNLQHTWCLQLTSNAVSSVIQQLWQTARHF